MQQEQAKPLSIGVTQVAKLGPSYAKYAGFVSRAMAMLVDLLIIGAVLITGGIAANFFARTSGLSQLLRFFANDRGWVLPVSAFFVSTSFELIVTLSFSYFYFAFFYLFGGATLGKYLFGLRVVSADGRRLTPAQSSLRVFGYALSALALYFGFLAVLADDQRRGWHDRIARTAVVHRWKSRPDEELLRRVLDNLD